MSSIFGREFDSVWPLKDFHRNLSDFGLKLLEQCSQVEKPQSSVSIKDFIKKSNEFPIKFPIDTCRVKAQSEERYGFIQQQIASAYPIIHEKLLYLIMDFLEHKLKYGSSKEKEVYTDMSVSDFIQRLLSKRCVMFADMEDQYILLTGETGCGDEFLKIGQEDEMEPFILKNLLSYDEMKISALLSVTSCSDFINDGRRTNAGRMQQDLNKFEREGVVIGLIGARYQRQERMEYEDIVITQEQNIQEKGYDLKTSSKKSLQIVKLQDYRRLWCTFYEHIDHLFTETSIDNKRYGFCYEYQAIFDNLMMKKRFAISFDILLLEANKRARDIDKLAYIHVVGIGLGVWKMASQQEKIFMSSLEQRLKYLLPLLNNVGVVHLSWFDLKEWGELKNEKIFESEKHPRKGIKILISKRNPNEKLLAPYDDMLSVVSFAWDGNALPGNEFWCGSLESSNDPSAACSTLITELFNPHINTEYVNGNNLHIASPKYGVMHIKDYAQEILKQKPKTSKSYKSHTTYKMPLFAKEFATPWPLKELNIQNLSTFQQELLQKCLKAEKPKQQKINIEEFIEKSNKFPIAFPIDSCRVKSQPIERHCIIEQQISSAYPLMHEKVLYLILDFLEHKLKYGSSIEKEIYAQMDPIDFVQRLLVKRCISFVGYHDSYILITGETGHGENYLKIATEEEKEPLTLAKCLSYDEIKIAALLSISCHSEFINDGSRHNSGKVEPDFTKIEKQGVVIGLVGARFARPERMEYEDIIISKEQNINEKGYGHHELNSETSRWSIIWQNLLPFTNKTEKLKKLQDYRRLWNKFYEDYDHLYKKVLIDDKRFGETFAREAVFDNMIMKKRFAIPLDMLLLEANERAIKAGKLAYIHVVGIGMGVWLAAPQQEGIFMECLKQRLKYLLNQLNNIGVIHLSWFKLNEWEDLKNETIFELENHPNKGIKILISKRNPNEKLPPPYDDMLPIVSFAWDGNSLPGNEFWMGSLVSSNDPSAACSTLITELFNPHINSEYVNGNNLHIVSPKYGVIHIKDYVEQILNPNK